MSVYYNGLYIVAFISINTSVHFEHLMAFSFIHTKKFAETVDNSNESLHHPGKELDDNFCDMIPLEKSSERVDVHFVDDI